MFVESRAREPSYGFVYPTLLAVVYVAWFAYMEGADRWEVLRQHWPISMTMTVGSFVAGATAEGGAAVAFPVFTKVLQIPSPEARTFGLMIQAVGMTMASVVILTRRIKILPRVVVWVSLGGILGQVIGTYLVTIPAPYPRILFTFVSSAFGATMALSRWYLNASPRVRLPSWDGRYRLFFLAIGVLGGSFAAQTGSGIDMATFIVLTLAFGVSEKVGTPTTVVIMGLNSVVGFFLHGVVSRDVGVVWDYWLAAVPVVVLGAPLGAVVASKVNRDTIIRFLLFLIVLELVTTLWLVPFSRASIAITGLAVVLSAIAFAGMLRYRRTLAPVPR